MQKYTFINNAGHFASYQALIHGIYSLLSKEDIFKSVLFDFEGKTLYFKTTIKEKDLGINIHILPTAYKLEVVNRSSKQIINTVLYNYTNFTELEMTMIFARKIIPAIKMIIGPSKPKEEEKLPPIAIDDEKNNQESGTESHTDTDLES